MTVRGAALAGLLAAAGCASTGYQRLGSDGGYADFPKDATTWVVTYRGNEATPREQIAMYLHYRCAEVTVQAGQQYFTVLASESQDVKGEWTTPGYASTTVAGGYPRGYGTADVTTTYQPPQRVKYVQPVLSATIQLSTGTKPDGGFDAREVLRLLAPRIGVAPPVEAAPTAVAPAAPAATPAPPPAAAPAAP